MNTYTTKQVAQKASVEVATVRKWIKEGKLPAEKRIRGVIGSGRYEWIIKEIDIPAFLRK